MELTDKVTQSQVQLNAVSETVNQHSRSQVSVAETVTPNSRPTTSKSVSKSAIVNKLNFINFSDRTITVNMKHSRFGTPLALQARPLPCAGEHLDCLWVDPPNPMTLNNHQFCNVTISEGRKCLVIVPHMALIDLLGISMKLPESGLENSVRTTYRHACSDVLVQITQNGAVYSGMLCDLNPTSFRIYISSPHSSQLQWLNLEQSVNLQLLAKDQMIYTGECRFVRSDSSGPLSSYVLAPTTTTFQRFKPKKFRSNRLKLVPSPNIVFNHPLTNRKVHLNVVDLSGSGLSVDERASNSLLFPGMIIPRLELKFSQRFSIACRAQVIYRTDNQVGPEDTVKCGMTILDMDMQDHVSLLSLLQQTENKHSFIDASVDMDMLWNFFFETGFIYPSKYVSLQDNKDDIKNTYEKLYNHCPSIARHFIHKNRGEILGHMSMVRFYNNAWLIHHHAAKKLESASAGLDVLRQISCYINDLHHLRSSHLKYVYCYFRPENKFPRRVFGGFANFLKNKKHCSLDKFAYISFKNLPKLVNLTENWQLLRIREEDYEELRRFYTFTSGGSLLEAFDLLAENDNDELSKEYQRVGLRKDKLSFSLVADGDLKALFFLDITETGFNMANLTNAVTTFILDESIPFNAINHALTTLSKYFINSDMNVLIYPYNYLDNKPVKADKSYTLWVLNMQGLDDYLLFCDRLFSLTKHNRNLAHE